MAASRSSSEHTCKLSRAINPTFKTPADFHKYSTGYWSCRVCIRESLKPAFLMSPAMAQAHEQLAYHRFNTRQPMYQFNTFAEDDASAWDGPNPVNETWAWLREQEFKAYNDKKNAEWNKQNPDWDKYNPEEDEFLHPHLRDTNKKPSRRKLPKNAATALDTKKRQQQRKKPDEQEDFDSVKGIRAGLGFYLHDPLPKPQRDITPWIASLRDASREENVWAQRCRSPLK